MNTNTSTLPRTLIELSGAHISPARLSNAVLLIIDAQREYLDGNLPLAGIDASLAAGGRLLARARAAGTPVVHILHRGGNGLFDPQGTGFHPAPPMRPEAGERIVEKTMGNAFADTDLADILAHSGRQQLIVVGYMTHNCISSTIRAARDHGYTCTVVAEATGTRDLPDGCGGLIPAATLQAACLAGLSDTYATIVHNADDIGD